MSSPSTANHGCIATKNTISAVSEQDRSQPRAMPLNMISLPSALAMCPGTCSPGVSHITWAQARSGALYIASISAVHFLEPPGPCCCSHPACTLLPWRPHAWKMPHLLFQWSANTSSARENNTEHSLCTALSQRKVVQDITEQIRSLCNHATVTLLFLITPLDTPAAQRPTSMHMKHQAPGQRSPASATCLHGTLLGQRQPLLCPNTHACKTQPRVSSSRILLYAPVRQRTHYPGYSAAHLTEQHLHSTNG